MNDLVNRKDFKECIEAMKLRYMKEAVNLSSSKEDREHAVIKHHLLDRLVVDLANYKPEEKQNG